MTTNSKMSQVFNELQTIKFNHFKEIVLASGFKFLQSGVYSYDGFEVHIDYLLKAFKAKREGFRFSAPGFNQDVEFSIPDIEYFTEKLVKDLIAKELEAKRLELKFTTENDELRLWLGSIKKDYSETDLAVMKHFLWQVKRKLMKMPCDYHMMPIIVGPQGTGKTVAVRQLVKPLQAYTLKMTMTDLSDSRVIPSLANHYIALCDEMARIEFANIETLKGLISSDRINSRKLGTHETQAHKQNCTLIGITNKNSESLIKDDTGARRFYEIQTDSKLNWTVINEVDYLALWQGINENAPCFITNDIVRVTIAEQQESKRFKTSIEQFIDDHGLAGGEIKVNLQNLYRAYKAWTEEVGIHRPLIRPQFKLEFPIKFKIVDNTVTFFLNKNLNEILTASPVSDNIAKIRRN